jgi:hypothetical protein
MALGELASNVASTVGNYAYTVAQDFVNMFSQPLPRSVDDIGAPFESVYYETIKEIFTTVYSTLSDDLQHFVDEKVREVKGASKNFDNELKSCKDHGCKEKFMRLNRMILYQFIEEANCCQNSSMKQMTLAATSNLVKNIRQTSQSIVNSISESAGACIECTRRKKSSSSSSSEEHVSKCPTNPLAKIPAAQPEAVQAQADAGREVAENGMKEAIESGKYCVVEEAYKFMKKLDKLREESKRCCHHSSSSSSEEVPKVY